jgi:hypothetical protein
MKAGTFGRGTSAAWRVLGVAGGVALLLAQGGVARATDGGFAAPEPECSDGRDNDGDRRIDFPEDRECESLSDGTEGGAADAARAGESGAFQTYYQAVVGSQSVAALASAAPELPGALHIEDSGAAASYAPLGDGGWELRITGFHRNHERVDAIYDMVLVLALPAAPDGGDGFTTTERGVRVEEGPADRPVPLVYGGEKVVLKRNVGLEKGLLARLVGNGEGQIPPLEGTGYRWTAWNAIVARDAGFGDLVQARALLRYEAREAVAPDPSDPRLAAYLITWVPSLPASVPPYAVRIAVQGSAP